MDEQHLGDSVEHEHQQQQGGFSHEFKIKTTSFHFDECILYSLSGTLGLR